MSAVFVATFVEAPEALEKRPFVLRA